MKKFISRITTMLMAVFTVAIIAAVPMSASAADNDIVALAVSEANTDTGFSVDENGVITLSPMAMASYDAAPVIQQLGNGQQQQQQSGSGSGTADTAYENVMTFIVTWIRRLGAAVALFGGIMLALGFKDNDADSKEKGIKTMVAGFVVWAICAGIGMFDLFS